jgi:ketosteroid isomerase-like protein
VTDWGDASPDFGVLHGVVATQEALASHFETVHDFHVEPEEVLHAEARRVVTTVRDGGRLRASDVEVRNRFFHAWTSRNGKLIRLSSHLEKNKALAAVGLSE